MRLSPSDLIPLLVIMGSGAVGVVLCAALVLWMSLTRLTKLGLSGNSITDVSALSELTALTELRLSSNPGFSNIEPLLDHREIDSVSLLDTRVSCANVARLQSNGLFVFSACQ